MKRSCCLLPVGPDSTPNSRHVRRASDRLPRADHASIATHTCATSTAPCHHKDRNCAEERASTRPTRGMARRRPSPGAAAGVAHLGQDGQPVTRRGPSTSDVRSPLFKIALVHRGRVGSTLNSFTPTKCCNDLRFGSRRRPLAALPAIDGGLPEFSTPAGNTLCVFSVITS